MMFWSSTKQIISNGICPITHMPIQDLVREDPSRVVVFHHPQKKICFAYEKEALMHWFYKTSKNELLQGNAEFSQIILQDLLSRWSLEALTLKQSDISFWGKIDEHFLNKLQDYNRLFIPLFTFFAASKLLNEQPTESLLVIFILITTLALGFKIAEIFNRYAIPKLREVAKENPSFEKHFKAWFEKNYLPFDPSRHQLSDEPILLEVQQAVAGPHP